MVFQKQNPERILKNPKRNYQNIPFGALKITYRHLPALRCSLVQNFAIICKISLLGAKFCTYVRKRESDKIPRRYFVQ
jgi:hypothetical protein